MRNFALLTIAAVSTLASAQKQLVFTPYHATGIYALGDLVGWHVSPAPGDQQQHFTYTIKENNDRLLRAGTLDLSQGAAEINVRVNEPAMLLVRVEPDHPLTAVEQQATSGPEAGKAPASEPETVLGAAVAPEQFKPAVPAPADFDAFWQSKLRALEKIPAAPELSPVASESPDVDLYTVKLASLDSHVQGYLAKPARPGKFPALIVYQWAGVYKLHPEESVKNAEKGWLIFDVDSHDLAPNADTGVPTDYFKMGASDRETSYFLDMYLRDTRALQYIESRPDWDGKTLVLMGTSMGGQQSLVTAGLNPGRISAVLVNEPAGADSNGELHGRQAGYPYWNAQNSAVMKAALYFDTVNFAPHITAPTLIGVGFLDTTAPAAGLFTVYNELAGPKEIVPMLHSAHNNLTPDKQGYFLERQRQVLNAAFQDQPLQLKPLSLYEAGRVGEAFAPPAHPQEPLPGNAP